MSSGKWTKQQTIQVKGELTELFRLTTRLYEVRKTQLTVRLYAHVASTKYAVITCKKLLLLVQGRWSRFWCHTEYKEVRLKFALLVLSLR